MNIIIFLSLILTLSFQQQFRLEVSELIGSNYSLQGWTGISYLKQYGDQEFIYSQSNLTKTFKTLLSTYTKSCYIIIQFIALKSLDSEQQLHITIGTKKFSYNLFQSSLIKTIRIKTEIDVYHEYLPIEFISSDEFGISQLYIIVEQKQPNCLINNYDFCLNCINGGQILINGQCKCNQVLQEYNCQEQCSQDYVKLNQLYCVSKKFIDLIYEDKTEQTFINKYRMLENQIYGPYEFHEQRVFQYKLDNNLVYLKQFVEFDLIILSLQFNMDYKFFLNFNDNFAVDFIAENPYLLGEGEILQETVCSYSPTCMQITIRTSLFNYKQDNFVELFLRIRDSNKLKFEGSWGIGKFKIFGITNLSETCQIKHCKECYSQDNKCKICDDGYYLLNDYCVHTCPYLSKPIDKICIDDKPELTIYNVIKTPQDFDQNFELNNIIVKNTELLYKITQKDPLKLTFNTVKKIGFSIKAKFYLISSLSHNKVIIQLNEKTLINEINGDQFIYEEYFQSNRNQVNLTIFPRNNQQELHLQSITILSYQCPPYCSECDDQQSCKQYEISLNLFKDYFDFETCRCQKGYDLSYDHSQCMHQYKECDSNCITLFGSECLCK